MDKKYTTIEIYTESTPKQLIPLIEKENLTETIHLWEPHPELK